MKPEFEKIHIDLGGACLVKKVTRNGRPLLTQAWHYHPEVELCYTVRSKGRRFVGNNISDYHEGDLVLLGGNLPHGFITDERTEQYVIQFKKDFLGLDFYKLKESAGLVDLFDRAAQGLFFQSEEIRGLDDMINDLMVAGGLDKLIKLLDILNKLTLTKHTTICSKAYSSSLNLNQLNRLEMIFNYMEEHFHEDISVASAAARVNLTESAFYKFMKRHTNKKFTSILNEYRIDHASRLLLSSDLSVAEISFKSGFNNLSYFNRKFKDLKSLSPREFKKMFQN